jgi:hypothetical protein
MVTNHQYYATAIYFTLKVKNERETHQNKELLLLEALQLQRSFGLLNDKTKN